MVGGTVKEIIGVGDRVWISCAGGKYERGQECAIYVQPTPEALLVRPGDAVWWQGARAYWTRPGGKEVAIPRIGYSGVSRPRVARA